MPTTSSAHEASGERSWPSGLPAPALERLLERLAPGDRARLRATSRAGREVVDGGDVMVTDYEAYPLTAREPRREELQRVEAGGRAERLATRLGAGALQVLGTACVGIPLVSRGAPGWWPLARDRYDTLVWTTLWTAARAATALPGEALAARRRRARALAAAPRELAKRDAELAYDELRSGRHLSEPRRTELQRVVARAVHVLHSETRGRPVIASSLVEIRARVDLVSGPYRPPFFHLSDCAFAHALDARSGGSTTRWLALRPEGPLLAALFLDQRVLPIDLSCGLAHLFSLGISRPPVWRQVTSIERAQLGRACEDIVRAREALAHLPPCPAALRLFVDEAAFRSLWCIAFFWGADSISEAAFEVRLAHLGARSVTALPSLSSALPPCSFEEEEGELAQLRRDAHSRLPRDRTGVLCRRLRRRFGAVEVDRRGSLPTFSELCADIARLDA